MIEKHRKVLSALYELSQPHGEMCVYYRTIAKHTGMEERIVRNVVRHLARKGYAEYIRGLCDEYTGLLAGSGHCITKSGIEVIRHD